MSLLTREKFEFLHGVQIDTTPWNCNINSIMADRILKYNEITECKLTPEYADPTVEKVSLCTLLKRDFEFFAENIADVANLRDQVEIFQYDGNTPDATVLLPARDGETAGIGMSSAFIKFLHLYLSKFLTLLQFHREENIHDDFLEEVNTEKWGCLEVYLSVLNDAVAYDKLNYDDEIQEYLYLYQPYDYCDSVVAARQFALLHELAHLHIKQNFDDDQLNAHNEEMLADRIAYSWLVQHFSDKATLSEEETYDLAMRLQAPFHYFAARNFAFAVHHWDKDKVAVLKNGERDHYMLHPLRREMALFASMRDQSLFHRHPEMVRYLYIYILKEHIAHEPDTFFRHEYGPMGPMYFKQKYPGVQHVMTCLKMSVSDAYHLYSALDWDVAFEHGKTLGWLHAKMVRLHRSTPEGQAQSVEDTANEIYRIVQRRMGLTKSVEGRLDDVHAAHEQRFGQAPMRAYDISKLGYKRWFGTMQIEMQIIAEGSRETITSAVGELDAIGAELQDVQETRNIDGGDSLLLVGLSVDFVIGTAAGVLAGYLYDLLKKVGARRFRMEGEIIPISRDDIERLIKALEERETDK